MLFFEVTIFLIFYHYLLFPLGVAIAAFFFSKPTRTGGVRPRVSIVIAAFNEAKVIDDKIRNSLSQDYPADLLEVLVVADGSNDDTVSIAQGRLDSRLTVLHEFARRGKSAALNRGVSHATGEIVVLTDANTFLKRDALLRLVQHFGDPQVGGVSGRKVSAQFKNRQSTQGDTAFWSVESRLKTWESQLGSIPIADGELFAVRRSLYQPIPQEVINDDAEVTLHLVKSGYRVLYEPDAVTEEAASLTLEEDFRVKARMVYGGFQTIERHADLLLPPRSFFAVQFLSHKLLRYLMPNLLVLLFLESMLFVPDFFLLQTLFYGAALLGLGLHRSGKSPGVFYFPLYYCTMNAAAFVGLYYFLTRKNTVAIWKKAER